jgi:hypothetical protein
MAQQFEDIVIVDLDVQKTTWSRVHSAMRTLYLKLNRDPDIAWTKFFFEERNSRVEVKRHGLWIEDGYIVFDCLLIDVDDHHLPDIRLSIAHANERSHELVESQREEREQLKAKARDEAQILKSLRANIRDDRERAPPESTPAPSAVFETEAAAEPATAISLEEAAQSQLDHPPAHTQPELEPQSTAVGSASDAREPQPAAQATPPLEPVPPEPEVSEVDLQLKRNDWRARFRAAFERNKN